MEKKYKCVAMLTLPEFIRLDRKNRKCPIDSEIVGVIKHLWDNKIYTLGCCDGHGKLPPSVVVGDGYQIKEIKRIEKLIADKDGREWDIMQWKIRKVN